MGKMRIIERGSVNINEWMLYCLIMKPTNEFKQYMAKVFERLDEMDEPGPTIARREDQDELVRYIEGCFNERFSVGDAASYIFYTAQPDELPQDGSKNFMTEDLCIQRMAEIRRRYMLPEKKEKQPAERNLTLARFTTEQLQAELEFRKTQPKPMAEVDWTPVYSYVVDVNTRLMVEGEQERDFEHYLFERVLEAMYGPKVWDWYNKL